jgi:hypothetical protein
MAHWFDSLATQWAQLAEKAAAPPPVPVAVLTDGPCMITTSGKQSAARYSVQNSFQGKPLTLDGNVTYGVAQSGASPAIATSTLTVTSTKVCKLGTDLLFQISRRSSPGSTMVSVSYGPAFQGIKQSTSTSDGKTVQGTIDGRDTVPMDVKAGLSGLKFKDGAPAPSVRIDPSLKQAIAGILKQGQQAVASCSHHSDPCQSCLDACAGADLTCDAAAAISCIASGPAYGLCIAVGVGACMAVYDGCFAVCQAPGQPCCATSCPDGTCCETGQTCAKGEFGSTGGSSSYICCPAGQAVCSNMCCPPGITECNQGTCCASSWTPTSDGSCCQPHAAVCSAQPGSKTTVCCGLGDLSQGVPPSICSTEGICCPPLKSGPPVPVSCKGVCCEGANDICTPEGICCPAGQPVCKGEGGFVCCQGGACDANDFCCPPPSHFCNGSNICCPPFNVCCGTVCCDLYSVCLDGGQGKLSCCPESQACGSVCCPTGHMCTDSKRGTCGACPSGTVTCMSENATGPLTAICCASGVDCCAGKCCASGEICCTPVDGPEIFGCWPGSKCIQ